MIRDGAEVAQATPWHGQQTARPAVTCLAVLFLRIHAPTALVHPCTSTTQGKVPTRLVVIGGQWHHVECLQ